MIRRGKCETCPWRPPDESLLVVHHVYPQQLGGSDIIDNLILLCPNCHAVAHWLLRIGETFPEWHGKVKLRKAIRENRTLRRSEGAALREMEEMLMDDVRRALEHAT